MSRELHIASFIVQHRAEALPALSALIASHDALELVIPGELRSIVLCETEEQRALMDYIDTMQTMPGVLTVSLIYHHAEPREALEKPTRLGDVAGATP